MAGCVAYVGLGSNVGERAATLIRAARMLDEVPGVEVRRLSRLIETAPVGGPEDQPAYLNGAVAVETTLGPHELLGVLQQIEQALGRERSREERWGPRTCDLDLLLMGETAVDEDGLTIPHPRMHERLFVLRPLCQIAPDAMHATLGRTVRELLSAAEAGR